MSDASAVSALAALELRVGHGRGRRATTVLAGLDLTLDRGELVCLLGPNGAGKSTLLRTLGGLQPPLAGRVEVGGLPLTSLPRHRLARHLSVVLTARPAVGHLTAYDLVALGRFPHTGWTGRLSAHDHRIVRDALAATRTMAFAGREVATLSDGERQRTLIARALAQEPSALLLDEPTAFLDLTARVEVTALLRRTARDTGLAVLMSTHDLDLALRTADTLWLLLPDGTVAAGAPEDLVLGGTVEASFPSTELCFDPEHGTFHHHTPPRGRVTLVAEGLPGRWIRRALARAGYEVVAPGTDETEVAIRVAGPTAAPTWHLQTPGGETTHSKIRALLRALRAAHDPTVQ